MTRGINYFPTRHVFVGGGCRRRLGISLLQSPYPDWPGHELHATPAWREESASSQPGQTPSLRVSEEEIKQTNK